MRGAVRAWLMLVLWSVASTGAVPREIDPGLAIMANRTAGNCISCHDIPALREFTDTGRRLTLQGTFGPSLQGVGQRYSPDQLKQWIVDARVMRPETLMPPYGTTHGLNAPAHARPLLTASQIDAVVQTLSQFTQTAVSTPTPLSRHVQSDTPTPSSVQQILMEQDMSPVVLWVERGRQVWERSCVSCHDLNDVANSVPRFPRLNAQHHLVNLEDQINRCRQRGGEHNREPAQVEDVITLSLSAWLHQSARLRPIQILAPHDDAGAAQWQYHLDAGEQLYNTRMGHMNLSCQQCHDGKVGAAMRAQRIPSAHPVGFPVYRISWQGMGSMDRRIRACFSGVQAQVPAAQDQRLRQLELYMQYRAQGRLLEGPSLKP